MKCVMISVDDQGQASVGECPPAMAQMMSQMQMQPAESVDAALSQAAQMLGGGDEEAQEQEGFKQGYAGPQGGAMQAQGMSMKGAM